VVGPFVQILLDLRAHVRADKRFDLSDMIRDRFAEINVEVRDTPQGVEWGFRQED
jgi:cysteinyl-tRNA synthetase